MALLVLARFGWGLPAVVATVPRCWRRLIAQARAGGSPGGRNAYRLGAVAAQLVPGRDGAAPRATTRTA